MKNSLSDRVSKLEDGTNKLLKVVFERLDAVEDETPILKPIPFILEFLGPEDLKIVS